MSLLCVPDEYEAILVDSYTQQTILHLPWSSITWQRVRNNISTASVLVAGGDGGIECCGPVGGLVGWEQMLRIERNGHKVWDGPVMGWNTKEGNLTIKAMDRFILSQKRLIGNYRFFSDVTIPAGIMRDLVVDGDMGNMLIDPYAIRFPDLPGYGLASEPIDREYLVERLERIFDCLTELTNSTDAAFFTCVNEDVYFSEGYCRNAALQPYGALVLNEKTTIGPPSVDVDCLGQATITYVGGNGQGVNGFPAPYIITNAAYFGKYLTSVLERAQAESRAATQESLRDVSFYLASEAAAPSATVEQIRLSPDFGSEFLKEDLSNFLPGARLDVRFTDTCAFEIPQEYAFYGIDEPRISNVRLDQLDVTVQRGQGGGIDEVVLASCRPTPEF